MYYGLAGLKNVEVNSWSNLSTQFLWLELNHYFNTSISQSHRPPKNTCGRPVIFSEAFCPASVCPDGSMRAGGWKGCAQLWHCWQVWPSGPGLTHYQDASGPEWQAPLMTVLPYKDTCGLWRGPLTAFTITPTLLVISLLPCTVVGLGIPSGSFWMGASRKLPLV